MKRVNEVQESDESSSSTADGGPVAKKVKLSADDIESTVGSSTLDNSGEARSFVDFANPFKEDPYTFVSPDDPTLVTCMYVNVVTSDS